MNKKDEKKCYAKMKKSIAKNGEYSKTFFEEMTIEASELNPCRVYIKESKNLLEVFTDEKFNDLSFVGTIILCDTEVDDGQYIYATDKDIREMLKNSKAYIIGTDSINMARILIKETNKPKEKLKEPEEKAIEKEIVSLGIQTEEELQEKIEFLKEHGITKDDWLYKPVLSLIFKQENNIKRPSKTYRNVTNGESLVKRVLRNIALGDPVILEGAKSCGKNVCLETISWVLNRPMEILNCSGKMTRADMMGSPSTDNSAKESVSLKGAKAFFKSLFSKKENDEAAEFVKNIASCMSPSIKLEKGPVTRAICSAEYTGTILVADELNLSDPNTFAGSFNALTDKHTTEYNINGLGKVKLSPNLIICGTQNGTGGAYVGTKQQNDATMSRFNVIRIDSPASIGGVLKGNSLRCPASEIEEEFPTEEKPVKTLSEKGFCLASLGKVNTVYENVILDDEVIDLLDRVYKKFSAAKTAGTVSETALNVRGFERALLHISVGQNPLEAITECVINTCKASEHCILIEECRGQGVE